MARAIVIGAGFGGMAAALRLRKKGYDVTIIDKQDQLGGRATQYVRHTPHGRFVHDAGPTVITAKFLFDELFELFGKRREDYVEFRDIDPWYRIVFAGDVVGRDIVPPLSAENGGTVSRPTLPFFDYGGTLEQFEAQIAKFEPRDVEGFRKFLAHSKKIFDVGFTQLGDQPFDKFTTMLRYAPQLLRLQNYKTVYGMASQYITNEKLRRVFSFQPLLVGGNPFNTTSIYSLIVYLERQWGVQFAMGGTGAIVRGLERLMREEGIEIRLNTEATWIGVDLAGTKAKRPTASVVTGVDLLVDGKPVDSIDADLVVANTDTPYAYEKLISKDDRSGLAPRRVASMKYSMGLFVLYFGTTKPYPDVAHHTIVLGHAYKELITKLFDTLELETEDLSVYLHRPTATDPSLAPVGCDSFYVLVPVPNLQSRKNWPLKRPVRPGVPTMENGGIDWGRYGETFKQHVIRFLERTVLPGLSDCIVDDFYVTPRHFEQNLNTLHGTGFSIAPTFFQSGYFRFHNKAPGIDGLYFVGAGTHPGAGMPGVLCSAKVVDRLIPAVSKR